MEELPDDVLLMAMSLLDVPDLLACRLVCKRIGDLVLHPDVWRRRYFVFGSSRDEDSTVLRFAPRLEYLSIQLPCSPQQLHLYTATMCAVSELKLCLGPMGSAGLAYAAALIIRNQESLGRLEELEVDFYPERGGAALTYPLLWALAYTSGLRTLVVYTSGDICDMIPAPYLVRNAPRPTLKSIHFTISEETVPFCEFVLAAHAPTLEKVNFHSCVDFFTPALPSATSMASLLAGMPHLRLLEDCPLIPEMEALAACKSLRTMSICVGVGSRPLVPAGAEFLRRAKELRHVTLKYNADIGDVGVDLVLALGSSVESLHIQFTELYLEKAMPQVQALSRALPRMPAVKWLTLPMTSREVLLAITPEANPALRTLELYQGEQESEGCAHRYLHWDSVVTVLSKNPLLELGVHATYRCSGKLLCDWCKLECHREVWKLEQQVRPWPRMITIPRLK